MTKQEHKTAGGLVGFLLAFLPIIPIVYPKFNIWVIKNIAQKYEKINPSPDSEQDIEDTIEGATQLTFIYKLINIGMSTIWVYLLYYIFW